MPDIYALASAFDQQIAAKDKQAAGRMLAAYADAYRAIRADLDGVTQMIADAYAAGMQPNPNWPKPGGPGTFSPDWLQRQQRYRNLLAQIEAQIRKFAKTAEQTAVAQQQDAVDAALSHSTQLVNAALLNPGRGVTTTFHGLSEEAAQGVVGFAADGTPLSDLFGQFGADAKQRATVALTNGLIAGHGPYVIAKNLQTALGVSAQRAMLIARTESMRVYRDVSIKSYQASKVVKQWLWWASRDGRTCPVCWAMHGTKHPLSEIFGSHPACRCRPLPITATWEDLGFHGIPETVPPTPTGEEEFRALPDYRQMQILGPLKFGAYRAGAIDLPDLVNYGRHPKWGPQRSEASFRVALARKEKRVKAGAQMAEDERRAVAAFVAYTRLLQANVGKNAASLSAADAALTAKLRAKSKQARLDADLALGVYGQIKAQQAADLKVKTAAKAAALEAKFAAKVQTKFPPTQNKALHTPKGGKGKVATVLGPAHGKIGYVDIEYAGHKKATVPLSELGPPPAKTPGQIVGPLKKSFPAGKPAIFVGPQSTGALIVKVVGHKVGPNGDPIVVIENAQGDQADAPAAWMKKPNKKQLAWWNQAQAAQQAAQVAAANQAQQQAAQQAAAQAAQRAQAAATHAAHAQAAHAYLHANTGTTADLGKVFGGVDQTTPWGGNANDAAKVGAAKSDNNYPGTVTKIPLADVLATNPSAKMTDAMAGNPYPVVVAKHNGKYYIVSNHAAAANQVYKGSQELEAKVIDLDGTAPSGSAYATPSYASPGSGYGSYSHGYGDKQWQKPESVSAKLDPTWQPVTSLQNSYGQDVDVDQTLKDHFNQAVAKLTATEKSAVRSYTGSAYSGLNYNLRRQIALDQSRQRLANNIDKALAKGAIDQPTIVYRKGVFGDHPAAMQYSDLPIGHVIHDRGFLSTAVVPQPAGSGFANPDFEIRLPVGTGGLYVDSISQFSGTERELILPRDGRYRVVDKAVNSQGKTIVILELESQGGTP